MSSGVKVLLKVLIAVVCYAGFFALAWVAFSDIANSGFGFGDSGASGLSWFICVILAVVGFIATRSFPYIQFPGIAGVMFTFFCRIIFAMLAGVFIAPWKITQKILSFFPE